MPWVDPSQAIPSGAAATVLKMSLCGLSSGNWV